MKELYDNGQPLHERVCDTVSAIGHSTARLAAVLALDSFPREEPISTSRLNSRLVGIDTERIKDVPIQDLPVEAQTYGLFRRNNIVTMQEVPGVTRPYNGAVLTPYGRSIVVAIAGELLSLENEAPQPGFLAAALGRSYSTRINPRLPMYRQLLAGPASSNDLRKAADVSRTGFEGLMDGLAKSGILYKQDRYEEGIFTQAAGYLYELIEPTGGTGPRKKELQAVFDVVAALRLEGVSQATGDLILRRACLRYPQIPPRSLWRSFVNHTQENRFGCCAERISMPQAVVTTPIALTKSARPYIENLMQRIDSIGGEGEDAEEFRQRARRRARALMGSQPLLRRLISQQNDNEETTALWRPLIGGLVPPKGITLPDLHLAVTTTVGRRIDYLTFQNALGSYVHDDPTLALSLEERVRSNGSVFTHVSIVPQEAIFPRNWNKQALCADENPDLFFPDSSRQMKQAKGICRRCPVLLPCLKTAVDQGIDYGVRGGLDLKHEKPDEKLRARLSRVHVTSQHQV